jgi:RNA polymerase-associated protein CTR9
MQRRSYAVAIKCYQNVLAMVPNFLPDPRVGISLCYWMQGEKAQARKGWERSLLVVRPFPSISISQELT